MLEASPNVRGNRLSRGFRDRLLFAVLALLMSFHFAMSYARDLEPAFDSTYAVATGHISIEYRPRLLTRYVYQLTYHEFHDQPPAFAHGVMSAQEMTIFLIAFVSILTIVFMTWASIGVVLGKASPTRWLSLLTIYMCFYQYMLTPQIRPQFPYDLPAVAAFALALYAMLTRNRWMFYAVILVASFNRETTFFLPPMFLILELDTALPLLAAVRKIKLWRWAEAALQLFLCVAIVHWCNVYTHAVLGPTFALPKNIHFVLSPQHWSTLLSIYGFLWVPYVVYFRRIGNVNLQRVALLFPFWFVAMAWKADLLEIRVQSEWIPYLTLCLALIIRNSLLLRDDVTAQSMAEPAGVPGFSTL
jgi:hypothetical protein